MDDAGKCKKVQDVTIEYEGTPDKRSYVIYVDSAHPLTGSLLYEVLMDFACDNIPELQEALKESGLDTSQDVH